MGTTSWWFAPRGATSVSGRTRFGFVLGQFGLAGQFDACSSLGHGQSIMPHKNKEEATLQYKLEGPKLYLLVGEGGVPVRAGGGEVTLDYGTRQNKDWLI